MRRTTVATALDDEGDFTTQRDGARCLTVSDWPLMISTRIERAFFLELVRIGSLLSPLHSACFRFRCVDVDLVLTPPTFVFGPSIATGNAWGARVRFAMVWDLTDLT